MSNSKNIIEHSAHFIAGIIALTASSLYFIGWQYYSDLYKRFGLTTNFNELPFQQTSAKGLSIIVESFSLNFAFMLLIIIAFWFFSKNLVNCIRILINFSKYNLDLPEKLNKNSQLILDNMKSTLKETRTPKSLIKFFKSAIKLYISIIYTDLFIIITKLLTNLSKSLNSSKSLIKIITKIVTISYIILTIFYLYYTGTNYSKK